MAKKEISLVGDGPSRKQVATVDMTTQELLKTAIQLLRKIRANLQ